MGGFQHMDSQRRKQESIQRALAKQNLTPVQHGSKPEQDVVPAVSEEPSVSAAGQVQEAVQVLSGASEEPVEPKKDTYVKPSAPVKKKPSAAPSKASKKGSSAGRTAKRSPSAVRLSEPIEEDETVSPMSVSYAVIRGVPRYVMSAIQNHFRSDPDVQVEITRQDDALMAFLYLYAPQDVKSNMLRYMTEDQRQIVRQKRAPSSNTDIAKLKKQIDELVKAQNILLMLCSYLVSSRLGFQQENPADSKKINLVEEPAVDVLLNAMSQVKELTDTVKQRERYFTKAQKGSSYERARAEAMSRTLNSRPAGGGIKPPVEGEEI